MATVFSPLEVNRFWEISTSWDSDLGLLPLRFGRQGASWTSVCTLKKTGERHVATEWHMLFFQQVRRAWHGFRIVRVYVLLYRLYYGTAKCFVRFGNAGSQVWVWFNLIGPTVLRSTRRSPKVHGTRLQKQDLSVGDCTSPDAKNGKGACGQGFLVEWTCLQGSTPKSSIHILGVQDARLLETSS